MSDEKKPEGVSRRELLRNLGVGGAAAIAAGATGHTLANRVSESSTRLGSEYEPVSHADHGSYGHGAVRPA